MFAGKGFSVVRASRACRNGISAREEHEASATRHFQRAMEAIETAGGGADLKPLSSRLEARLSPSVAAPIELGACD